MEKVDFKCTCQKCGLELALDHKGSCPSCVNTPKIINISIEETISLHDSLEGKVKNPSKRKAQGKTGKSAKKPILEFFEGDDYSHSLNKFVHKERIIDRDNDSYSEIVKDKESNEVIHEDKEKLSDHFGHGSAKKS